MLPAAVVLAALTAGSMVYVSVLLPRAPFAWDEAAHALRGLLIAHDVRNGDWLALLYDTYGQVYWPPVHAWLTGAAFLMGGATPAVARSVSLIAFVLLIPILFLAGRELCGARGDWAGVVAALLALTSPPLIAHAAQAMLEMPALLALSVTLYIYIRLGREGLRPQAHASLGLAIMLTYFIRSSYGILLLLAIGITRVIEASFRPRRLLTRDNAYVALPIVLLSALWFAYPPKVVATWFALINQAAGGPEAQGIGGLLFYPRALLHYSGSIWIFLLFLASLGAAWWRRRDRNVRLLLVLIIMQFLIGAVHHSKVERYILTVLPPLFLLMGMAVAEWLERLLKRRIIRAAAVAALASVLILQIKSGIRVVDEIQSAPPTREVLDYISGLVRGTEPALVLSTIDVVPGPPVIDWHLIIDQHLLAVPQAGSLSHVESERRSAEALRRASLPWGLDSALHRVLTRYDGAAGTRSFYLGLPTEIDRPSFDAFLRSTVDGTGFNGVVVITSLSDDARYPLAFVEPILQRAGLGPVSSHTVADPHVRVDLYRPVKAPAPIL